MIEELPEHQQRLMIEKLLGRDNAEWFTKQKDDRKFRPKPVVVTYEFYRIRGDRPGDPTFWRINRVENGRTEQHEDLFYSEAECIAEVASLRRKGFTVKEIVFGDDRSWKARPRSSGRRVILDQLKDFRP